MIMLPAGDKPVRSAASTLVARALPRHFCHLQAAGLSEPRGRGFTATVLRGWVRSLTSKLLCKCGLTSVLSVNPPLTRRLPIAAELLTGRFTTDRHGLTRPCRNQVSMQVAVREVVQHIKAVHWFVGRAGSEQQVEPRK